MFGQFYFLGMNYIIIVILPIVATLIILLSLRRKENASLIWFRRFFAGSFLAILIPLAMIHGIKAFMPAPLPPAPVHSWVWEDKLKMLEQKGDTTAVEKLKTKIAQREQEYKEKSEIFNIDMLKYIRIRRLIAIGIGIVCIIFGTLLANNFLGAGFIVAGVVCIANATTHWWYRLSDVTRFSIIIGALFLLFLIGYFLARHARRKYKEK